MRDRPNLAGRCRLRFRQSARWRGRRCVGALGTCRAVAWRHRWLPVGKTSGKVSQLKILLTDSLWHCPRLESGNAPCFVGHELFVTCEPAALLITQPFIRPADIFVMVRVSTRPDQGIATDQFPA